MRLCNLDHLGPAHLTAVRLDVDEVHRQRLRIDGVDHLLLRLHLHECHARLANLVVEVVAMGLLNDDLGLWKARQIRTGFETRLKVFGQHAGITHHDAGSHSARHQAGITGRGLAELFDIATGGNLKLVD